MSSYTENLKILTKPNFCLLSLISFMLSHTSIFPLTFPFFSQECAYSLFIKSISIIIPPSTWATPLTEGWCGHSDSILPLNHTVQVLTHQSSTSFFSFLTTWVQLISKPMPHSCRFAQCQPSTRDAVRVTETMAALAATRMTPLKNF